MYETPLSPEIREIFHNQKTDDEIRANFPGFDDDQINAFFENYFDSKKSKIEIDSIDLMLAGILRNFNYDGLVDFLGAKPTPDEIMRISNAADYLRLIDQQRRDSVTMISATEAQKRDLADARNNLSHEISKIGRDYHINEL